MKRFLALLLLLTLFSVPAIADKATNVVCSFYPIMIFARNLLDGVENVTLTCLTAPDTGCLHDVQLLTGDMRTLSGADVLLINGAGMEGYLDVVFSQFPDLITVDASQGIELLIDEDEGHPNAHIWLNIDNASVMVENLAEGLCAAMPDETDTINANLDTYTLRLQALKEEMETALAPCAGKGIITFHEAFPYFAEEFDLKILATVVNEEDSSFNSISPAELARLIGLIRENDLPPLFTEPQYPSLVAETLSAETGAPVYSLDPAVTGEYEKNAYEDAMRRNLDALLGAFDIAREAEQ